MTGNSTGSASLLQLFRSEAIPGCRNSFAASVCHQVLPLPGTSRAIRRNFDLSFDLSMGRLLIIVPSKRKRTMRKSRRETSTVIEMRLIDQLPKESTLSRFAIWRNIRSLVQFWARQMSLILNELGSHALKSVQVHVGKNVAARTFNLHCVSASFLVCLRD
jgi:hypothetical protein